MHRVWKFGLANVYSALMWGTMALFFFLFFFEVLNQLCWASHAEQHQYLWGFIESRIRVIGLAWFQVLVWEDGPVYTHFKKWTQPIHTRTHTLKTLWFHLNGAVKRQRDDFICWLGSIIIEEEEEIEILHPRRRIYWKIYKMMTEALLDNPLCLLSHSRYIVKVVYTFRTKDVKSDEAKRLLWDVSLSVCATGSFSVWLDVSECVFVAASGRYRLKACHVSTGAGHFGVSKTLRRKVFTRINSGGMWKTFAAAATPSRRTWVPWISPTPAAAGRGPDGEGSSGHNGSVGCWSLWTI